MRKNINHTTFYSLFCFVLCFFSISLFIHFAFLFHVIFCVVQVLFLFRFFPSLTRPFFTHSLSLFLFPPFFCWLGLLVPPVRFVSRFINVCLSFEIPEMVRTSTQEKERKQQILLYKYILVNSWRKRKKIAINTTARRRSIHKTTISSTNRTYIYLKKKKKWA